jgi:hypothetical protein
MDIFKNIFYLVPVIIYYFLEALLSAIFINLGWKYILQPKFDFQLGYFEWVIIIWIIKILFFDVFKLVIGLNSVTQKNDGENEQKQVL